MLKHARLLSAVKWLTRSVWAFPLVLLVLLLCLTALKIHGSSVGIYHQNLYGSHTPDPDLLFGTPKSIRSDEWRLWTPLTLSQVENNYPVFNQSLGSGRDVAIEANTPELDWVGLFRPHNWSFFVLPTEQAFAFRWWVVIFALITTAYFFILRFSVSKKFAILLSLALGLSPFLLWWHQSSVFLSMAYGLLGCMIGMRIIDGKKLLRHQSSQWNRVITVALLAYIGISFALLIYAPFLIPVAIVSAAFLLGYGLQKRPSKRQLRLILAIFTASLALIGCALLIFFTQHKQAISAISESDYPGQRVVKSGSQKPLALLSGFVMPVLQSGSRASNYYGNQSESSNFILLLPFLLIPGYFVLYWEYRKRRRIHWALLAVQLVASLFIARLYVPFGDGLYKVLLLDKVPHNRLLEGLGFAGFLQLVLLAPLLEKLNIARKKRWYSVAAYSTACWLALLGIGVYIIHTYPGFLHEYPVMIGLASFFTAILTSFLLGKKLIGAGLLLLFTLASSFMIMPLYQGLSFYQNSDVINKIKVVSSPRDSWIVLDSLNYEALPLAAGRKTIGGPQVYSDLSFWYQLDPTHRYKAVYNRQGHALFISNTVAPDPTKKYDIETATQPIELVKVNVFKIKFTCSEFTYKNIDYVLAITPAGQKHPCLQLVDISTYTRQTFYIYKVTSPSHGTSSKPSF